VTRAAGSPVTSVRLIGYENFNPIATRIPYLPITDWCLSQLGDQRATFDHGSQAIIHSWRGVDLANGAPTSVAFAFGWDGPAAAHQVGGDAYDAVTVPGAPPDGYTQAPSGTLGGSDDAIGQVTGALATDLAFSTGGVADARLIVAGSSSAGGAVRALGAARRRAFENEMADVRSEWRAWLGGTLLPVDADARVIEVAKRSLITLRLAMDRETGAIVASADTQGPYGEDWIRDGSFLNEVLDRNGFGAAVAAHNAFYVRVQTSLTNPSPVRPPGNWPMASYSDGIDGAPIPWEIDETGLGIWTLWRHAEYLPAEERRAYLGTVFPAIARAADWLTICRDPRNGLQCIASEDDNYTPSQSLHGAETVYLGLRSAIAAAQVLGDRARAARWTTRIVRLRSAIDALYDPSAGAWREGSTSGNAYNVDYGDGGWLLWPVAYRPYTDPQMRSEADAVRASLDASLASSRGEYEAKALLGLAYAWSSPTAGQRAELTSVLHNLAATRTTPTGLFGEAWERFGGIPKPVEDQPHVWEHALFYLSAIQIDGAQPYTIDAP
jgi:GH15 family glucan-1,4-alpha-glucosidase